MLDPTAEYILLFMVFAVVLAALAVLVRAVVATTSGCMSIPLKAVAFGERVKRLFSRQPAISTQRAKALTGKGSAKTLPVIHLDKATACQRGSADRQGPMPSTEGVATGRRPNSINNSGPPEGVAKGSPTSASGLPVTRKPGLPVRSLPVSAGRVAKGRRVLGKDRLQRSAKALRIEWRPLAPPHRALPAPVIPDAEAAMRFRIWLLEFGLEEIARGHGELIAAIDLWELAQRFAAGSGFRIGSRDRFFEALRKLPGIQKEEDRHVTRLGGGARQKRVAYSFRPANVANRKAAGGSVSVSVFTRKKGDEKSDWGD